MDMIDRRTALVGAGAAAVGLVGGVHQASAQGTGTSSQPVKLTVLYGHPTDPAAFEKYYAATHMPLVAKMSGVTRQEKAKVIGTPRGEKPPYYRMFEFWFESEAAMGATMGSPAGKAVGADLANFATGGVTSLISAVE
jgi:uncharacterized protein (TIGR02118 family)